MLLNELVQVAEGIGKGISQFYNLQVVIRKPEHTGSESKCERELGFLDYLHFDVMSPSGKPMKSYTASFSFCRKSTRSGIKWEKSPSLKLDTEITNLKVKLNGRPDCGPCFQTDIDLRCFLRLHIRQNFLDVEFG